MFEFFADVKRSLFPLSGSYTSYGDATNDIAADSDRLTLSVNDRDGNLTPIANVDVRP